ncbi:rnase h [Trichococcus palustris]|jgi:ribonuclease HI|uniref:Rnase h n=1 Tax=Trichococcus palustris TaxID=140314 RepID=A0A143YFD0_9LACT|nr:ribonuclease HI family protein [Trichococcus palustris]CZQ87227.1 rnase h [Trichococcus palustris]SFK79495.1 ribonuclease HI [Trichococcus palustris]
MIKAYIDGAVAGMEGFAAIGMLVIEHGVQTQKGIPLEKKMDNHQAEFEAFLYLLRYLLDNGKQKELIFCYTDSKLVSESIRKNYTKKEEHRVYLEEALLHLKKFDHFYLDWIPEKENRGADNLAKKALFQLAKKKRK